MKYICSIALLCLMAACSSHTPKQEAEPPDSSKTSPPAAREPEKKLNGTTILARTEWLDGPKTFLAAVSRDYDRSRQFGGIRVECWELGSAEPDVRWQYMDSLSCGSSNVVVSYNLDKLYAEDIDADGSKDLVVLYTLACALHVVPQPRYMIVFDKSGKTILKLTGKSLEPNASGTTLDVQKMDLQPAPKNEADPMKTQGRIDNYSELDKLSPAGKARLVELWRESLAKDKRVNVFDQ